MMNWRSILNFYNKKDSNISFFTTENKYKGALIGTFTLVLQFCIQLCVFPESKFRLAEYPPVIPN